ncbi:MAG: hypothetical protein O2930_01700 [Acidobacteria bacterium]|nr:hypothetical protein [Acidobacteriota bacterium]
MRSIAALSIVLILSLAAPAFAQEWTEFRSLDDGFTLNFPGQPGVEQTTFVSEFNYTLPARVYSAERGRERYSMTVVDYSGIEQMGEERASACPAAAEPCHGSPTTGPGYWRMDIGGAIVHATWTYLQRDVELTHMTWTSMDLVEGQQLQLTNNADESRTFVHISMHMHKLYLLEGTVPAGYPPPGLFQQSMGYVDADGNRVRYQYMYNDRFPPPPRTGR